MTSKAGRAAYAIKSGTVAAGMAVGSTLAYVAPQLAGAIDIVVVKQPDGSLKSSPFYVRFGKYTGLRSDPTQVNISVNESEADFCMHMGRTGEAYFIVDADSGERDAYAEALNGMASPMSGYSSDQEQLGFGPDQTAASLKSVLEEAKLRNASSTPALASIVKEDAAGHVAPGACLMEELEKGHTLRGELDSTLSAPASLASPPLPSENLATPDSAALPSTSQRRARDASLDKVRGWRMELPEDQRSLREEGRTNGAHPASSDLEPLSAKSANDQPTQAPNSSPGKDFSFSPKSSGSGSGSLHVDNGVFSPLETSPSSEKDQKLSRAPDQRCSRVDNLSLPREGHGLERKRSRVLRTLAEEGTLSADGSSALLSHSSRSQPVHPWSVGNPRLLPSPLAVQPQVAVMSSSDAAAKVHQSPAAGKADGSAAATAILPRRSMDEIHEAERERFGNRMELEAIDQKVCRSRETAPFAMAEAMREVQHWQQGGKAPRMSPLNKKLAQQIDELAVKEDEEKSGGQLYSGQDSQEDGQESTSSSGVASSGGVPYALTNGQAMHAEHGEEQDSGQQTKHSAVPNCLDSRRAHLQNGKLNNSSPPPQASPVVPTSPFCLRAHDETPQSSGQHPKDHPELADAAIFGQTHSDTLTGGADWGSEIPPGQEMRPPQNTGFGSIIDLSSAGHLAPNGRAAEQGAADSEEQKAGPNLPSAPLQTADLLGIDDRAAIQKHGPAEAEAEPCRSSPLPPRETNSASPQTDLLHNAEASELHLRHSGRSSQASGSTMAASSLPIGIPGLTDRTPGQPLPHPGVKPLERAIGGSLPAGAFGMSPTESARYLGNTSGGDESKPLSLRALAAPSDSLANWPASPGPREGTDGIELSLCASSLHPGLSPQEAWQAFEVARVTQEQFSEAGAALVADPELAVRLGARVLPYQQAAPALLGMLAFGSQWESLLPSSSGVQVQLPVQDSPERKNEGEKRSSWRVWLGSWRGRRGSKPDLATVAAAAAEAADGREGSRHTASPEQEPQLAGPELSDSLEGMMEAGKRQPGKRRAFTPSSQQLQTLQLNEGRNTIDFLYGKQRLRAYLFYFPWNVRLVISDVDGTITRSDLLGHVLPRVGFDWSHPGINRFFSTIERNGYHILFLSSRAIAQASATRDYLHSLNQDGHKLPCGPVIISPDGLFPSLYRELVLRRPHEFKIRALEDIRALFPQTWNPFFCGVGNRDTDEISYLTVGVPPSKIFIINSKGELRKASSAVVTSTWNSLMRIVDLVNEIFPPYEAGCAAAERLQSSGALPQREEYSDYNYWHVAPPIIVDSDDEAFGDPGLKGFGDSEEEESDEEEGMPTE